MEKIGYFLFRAVVALFSIIPMPLLYVFSDGLFYIFYYITKYRKRVVYENLKNSFPEKSSTEIEQLTKDFYKNFCDILLEGIKGLSMSKQELVKRYKITNTDLFDYYFDKKTSLIAVGSHFANWEWGVLCSSLQVKHKTIGFYMPLSNKAIDTYIRNSRAAWGMHLVSIKETINGFEKNKETPCIYILLSDQSPSNKDKSIWLNFLNQNTAFLHGAEKYAQLYNYPVLFIDVKRIKRGFYEVAFDLLCEKPIETKPKEITKLFALRLEKAILNKPDNWLWTHRRWKLTPSTKNNI